MIRLDNIHKAFGSKQVLTGFSLEVQEGDIAVILGYSGTGKSVALNALIASLMYKATPEEVKIVLIDPKRLEFTLYEDVQEFWVAEDDGRVVGCGALHVLWEDLGEIRTVAVDASQKRRGVGGMVVDRLIEHGRDLGIGRRLGVHQQFLIGLAELGAASQQSQATSQRQGQGGT